MRALLLDIGGVFYLNGPDAAYWSRWAKRCACSSDILKHGLWHGPDVEAANLGLIGREDYFHRAGERLRLSSLLVREMIEELFAGGFNVDFATCVRRVRDRGVSVSALTNSWHSEQELMARRELAGLFDCVVSSRDVGMTKPDPRIYRQAMKRMNRRPDELVFVDDTPECVAAARALGMHAIRFETSAQASCELRALFKSKSSSAHP